MISQFYNGLTSISDNGNIRNEVMVVMPYILAIAVTYFLLICVFRSGGFKKRVLQNVMLALFFAAFTIFVFLWDLCFQSSWKSQIPGLTLLAILTLRFIIKISWGKVRGKIKQAMVDLRNKEKRI